MPLVPQPPSKGANDDRVRELQEAKASLEADLAASRQENARLREELSCMVKAQSEAVLKLDEEHKDIVHSMQRGTLSLSL